MATRCAPKQCRNTKSECLRKTENSNAQAVPFFYLCPSVSICGSVISFASFVHVRDRVGDAIRGEAFQTQEARVALAAGRPRGPVGIVARVRQRVIDSQ